MTTTVAPPPAHPDRTDTPSPPPRRRAFGGLRRLGSTSPGDFSRLSPRSYFFRSGNDPPTSASAPPSIAVENTQSQRNSVLVANDLEDLELGDDNLQSPRTEPTTEASGMARNRRSTRKPNGTDTVSANPTRADGNEDVSSAAANTIQPVAPAAQIVDTSAEEKSKTPTIRFFPHQEARQSRPSLTFAPIVRTLPSGSSVIRIGRYSEREGIPVANPNGPSAAPVGFKSKVVSRKHCEFTFENGSWQIKDVSSSSGTFLNHIRLSQPNTESRLFPVKDGDIVQLGIDFRGGEEMIFRCVKIRIECNRSWQKRPNNFNMNRHAQLQKLGTKGAKGDDNKGECAICLGDVAPCQSLFIASCAHVWHYKCVRRMLMDSNYPQFTCPNCRAVTDLEAELDVEDGEWEQPIEEAVVPEVPAPNPRPSTLSAAGNNLPDATDTAHVGGAIEDDEPIDLGDIDLTNIHFETPNDQNSPTVGPGGLLSRRQASISSSSMAIDSINGIDIPRPTNAPQLAHITTGEDGVNGRSTPTQIDVISGEGPLTPRNDAGPVVFDGSAGRASGRNQAASPEDDIT